MPSGLLCGLVRCFYTGPDRSFYYVIRAFNVDQLDVIYTGSDVLRHSGFFSGLLQRLIENALKKALLIIPLPGSRLSLI